MRRPADAGAGDLSRNRGQQHRRHNAPAGRRCESLETARENGEARIHHAADGRSAASRRRNARLRLSSRRRARRGCGTCCWPIPWSERMPSGCGKSPRNIPRCASPCWSRMWNKSRRWKGSRVGIFVDVNPGMDRTGIEQDRTAAILELRARSRAAGLAFRGLHYYDGHIHAADLGEREKASAQRIRPADGDRRCRGSAPVSGRRSDHIGHARVPLRGDLRAVQVAGKFVHRASPGTVVYSDATSITQLPAEWGYQPAARGGVDRGQPSEGELSDLRRGSQSVSADAGVPTCAVAGRAGSDAAEAERGAPSDRSNGGTRPAIGEAAVPGSAARLPDREQFRRRGDRRRQPGGRGRASHGSRP